MGLDWDGEVYGGERSEETKNHLKSLSTVYERGKSWTGICLTLLGTASHHPPGLLNQNPLQKIKFSNRNIIISQPFYPRSITKNKTPGKPFSLTCISLPEWNKQHPLLLQPPSTSNAYIPQKELFVYIYIISQCPDHPTFLFH